MKGVLKLPFLAGVALLCMAQTRVTLRSELDSAGNGQAVVTDLDSVPLAAFLFEVIKEHCDPSPLHPRIFRGEDAATVATPDALNFSQSRSFGLGTAYCNKTGATVPDRALLKAAIFADGSSTGDAMWVDLLLDNRRLQLMRIEKMIGLLRATPERLRAHGGLSSPDVGPDRTLPCVDIPNADPVTIARTTLSDRSAPSQELVDRTIDSLEQLRARLLRAQPLVPPQTQPADPGLCGANG